jgi:nitrogen fixation/metabolism regulation signal transduction histidine kinase
MLKLISNYPISRRLIIAFALAAILPSVMIAIMGTYYVNQLGNRRAASSAIASAQDSTNSWSDSLHHLYTETKVMEGQVLSVLQANGSAAHSSLSSTLPSSVDETEQEATQVTSKLNEYQSLYDPQSQNMQPVINVLGQLDQNDNTLASETSLLNDITHTSWPQYLKAQNAELDLLKQIINHPDRYLDTPKVVASI